MSYGTGTAGQANTLKAADKPRIVQQIEQLEKVLSSCHQSASDLEHVADRILGPTPQDTAKASPTPPSDTIERKLDQVINYAEGLSARMVNASQRLNAAV